MVNYGLTTLKVTSSPLELININGKTAEQNATMVCVHFM